VSFKHVKITCFSINAIKIACEKHILLKHHVLLTCQGTHVNLIYELYEISYKSICRKFLSIYIYIERERERLLNICMYITYMNDS
jgi:hypothetical protein